MTPDEGWGLVNVEERAGWVSMRYMARQAGQWAGNLRPLASCYGTEPFWILDLMPEGSSLRWSTPEGELAGTIEERLPPANRVDVEALTFSLGDGSEGTGIVTARTCSDGMSDREFGLRLDLVLRGRGEDRLLSGCCTLEGL
ncbi:hypothetical protein GCM10011392_07580 [Wenxinia marina]|nr:hypothetical protein GCM10011392_07580 [Wenxinia marina]